MIKAVFYKHNGKFTGFSVSGHSGYAESGRDIICAYVTSAVELCCNTISEFYKAECDVKVEENNVTLKMLSDDAYSEKLLSSLCSHIEYTMQTSGHIKLEIKST